MGVTADLVMMQQERLRNLNHAHGKLTQRSENRVIETRAIACGDMISRWYLR